MDNSCFRVCFSNELNLYELEEMYPVQGLKAVMDYVTCDHVSLFFSLYLI